MTEKKPEEEAIPKLSLSETEMPNTEASQATRPKDNVGDVAPNDVVPEEEDNVDHLLVNIGDILAKLNISKVYFIDDAIGLDTNSVERFVGLVNAALVGGHLESLQGIPIQNAIDFTVNEEVLIEEIQQKWDDVSPKKKSSYFKHVYTILGQPEAIKDLNETSQLQKYFGAGILECLNPNQWVEQVEAICAAIENGKRIMVLFDQDLKLAEGKFADGNVKGQDLILDLKNKNIPEKTIVSLFTYTVTELDNELTERKNICDGLPALNNSDFFVLSKSRLEREDLFVDGLKKACLNTFCEIIKANTIAIIQEAQSKTISKLNELDTYDFDHTIFKSSYTEGVWEPETLLRITDVVFRDEVRNLMVEKNYVPQVNIPICSAKEISDIEIEIKKPGAVKTYNEKFKLRHQELYEYHALLNQLRRPIDNGDIFQITDGDGKSKKFILIAQECDLMVRSEGDKKGKRGSNVATFVEIEVFTDERLLSDMTNTYEKQIEQKKFTNHYFADKFQLEYFEEGTNKSGIVHFKKAYVIDLNVLDLIVFNETGEAALDVDNPAYNSQYHNFAWQYRYNLISGKFTALASELDNLYSLIDTIPGNHQDVRNHIKANLNHRFSFIEKIGIPANYDNRRFNFGIKRISRLRMPKSKNLLDRYYLHLSRFAELHDFAKH